MIENNNAIIHLNGKNHTVKFASEGNNKFNLIVDGQSRKVEYFVDADTVSIID